MTRLVTIILAFVVVGCARPKTEANGVDSSTSATQPEHVSVPTGLYTDEEIRKLAGFDIPNEADYPNGILGVPSLDVVPNGESYPREKVFGKLKIDDSRIQNFRYWGFNFVLFLYWQVSPSYDICCMTATNDPENSEVEPTDPKRKVYGIRLVRRHE